MTRANVELITIRGIFVPESWDDEGNVTGLAILTSDEDKYVVKKDKNFDELLVFLRKEMEVDGKLRVLKSGKTISVQRFRPVIDKATNSLASSSGSVTL